MHISRKYIIPPIQHPANGECCLAFHFRLTAMQTLQRQTWVWVTQRSLARCSLCKYFACISLLNQEQNPKKYLIFSFKPSIQVSMCLLWITCFGQHTPVFFVNMISAWSHQECTRHITLISLEWIPRMAPGCRVSMWRKWPSAGTC